MCPFHEWVTLAPNSWGRAFTIDGHYFVQLPWDTISASTCSSLRTPSYKEMGVYERSECPRLDHKA